MSKFSLTNASLPESVNQSLQDLGERLRAIRITKGLTLRQMADRLMCSVNTYRSLEAGKPTVSIGLLAATLWNLQQLDTLDKIAPVPATLFAGKRAKRHAGKPFIAESELDF